MWLVIFKVMLEAVRAFVETEADLHKGETVKCLRRLQLDEAEPQPEDDALRVADDKFVPEIRRLSDDDDAQTDQQQLVRQQQDDREPQDDHRVLDAEEDVEV